MHRRFTATIALLIALVLSVASVNGAWQRAASITKPDAAALSSTDEILKVVSRLRALDILQAVKSSFKTKDEIEQFVIRDLDENTPPEEFEASQKTLVKLGLVNKSFRLRDYVVQLLREQVAGFYEPKTKEFYLAAWLPVPDQKRVIAHELVHALQDQHFNLRRFEDWPKGDSDAELAAHALVEGEATLIMIEYDFEQQGMKLDMNKIGALTDNMIDQDAGSDAKAYPVLANAPKVLKENLQFPYLYGAGFVGAVLKNRSWQTLDTTYASLPASTEQIMHPERFLTRDNPVKIEMPDLAGSLGPNWKKADADVNGEFGYLVALAEFIPRRTARTAASGWGGDRYALYENKASGGLVLAQYTTWDTENDAREFFDAYSERTEKRYKVVRPANANTDLRVYETNEGLASIELRGKDVVMIEGPQAREQWSRASDQVWKSKKANEK
ncbi:MAG TPA: hypothetical protein VLG74_15375 [Blastocatellia bacterium]|nr:hypothetical protein [Blastocatellia bacterium]